MKTSIKKSLLIGTFLLGIAFSSNAVVCATVRVFCPDGSGTNTIICAEDYELLNIEIRELYQVVCEQ